MTIIAWADSTPRRHCEAKEKIPGERKIHLPKQSHPQLTEWKDCFVAKYRFLRMVNHLKCRFVDTNVGEGIQLEQPEKLQVFLPYVFDPKTETTFFQQLKDGDFYN